MATTEGDGPRVDQPPEPSQSDLDCVVTTVVGAPSPRGPRDPLDSLPPMNLGPEEQRPPPAPDPVAEPPAPPAAPAAAPAVPPDAGADMVWLVGEVTTARKATTGHAEQLAAVEARLAAVEGVPGTVEALSRATRQELERCAGVLFAHDRALNDARDRLETLIGRLEAIDAKALAEPAPETADKTQVYDQALARILGQLDTMVQRLEGMEARVEPLEAVPTVVQALRRAVRSNDELVTGEAGERERAVAALAGEVAAQTEAHDDALRRLLTQELEQVAAVAKAQATSMEDLAARVAAAEARLAPLDSTPADVEALSRVMRRELDAVVTDNQARDQMLRRALQNEIDQLHAASEAREKVATELATRLEAVDGRLGEAVEAHTTSVAAATGRLDALEGRMAAADALGPQVEALRDLVRTELEQLRADAKAHDQLMGEITRKFAALDGRLARFDAVPGELQSLRTALRQESERTVTQVRAVEERLNQLGWVPGEFQEARKRILALTTGLQQGQDSIRSLETALAATNDRLKAVAGRLGPTAAPRSPA